jgi:hypothetical protein
VEGADCIVPAKDLNQWRALVSMLMTLCFAYKAGGFLDKLSYYQLLRIALLQERNYIIHRFWNPGTRGGVVG